MAENTKTKADVGSAFDLIGKSFELVKKNWVAFAVVNILTLISALFPYDPEPAKNGDTQYNWSNFSGLSGVDLSAFIAGGIALIIAVAIIAVILFAMMTVLEVQASAGKQPSVGELFEKAKKNLLWLKLLGLMILSGIIIVAGFILLIIPGIIALARLVMAPYFMVEKNLGVFDSMKASNEMGKKYFWKVLAPIGVIILVAIGASFISIIPLIGGLIGAIINIGVSLVVVLRYQQLKKLA